MSSANAGWLFYKEMYRHLYISDGTRPQTLDNNYVAHINSEIIKTELERFEHNQTNYNFTLTTLYPGLLIGAGYNHAAKDCKDNFDFGFFFDHVTGMPLLPGSSIKGVIRSIFKKLDDERQKESVVAYFKFLFMQCQVSIYLGESTEDAIKILHQMENHIFDGIDAKGNKVSLYERDKFFDAYIVEGDTVRIGGTDKELIFADDYITPHYQDLLSEPEPNHMLKVRSGVTFEFNFDLKDSLIDDSIHILAHQKLSLFQAILAYLGVGAKTNVGYGQFETVEETVEERAQGESQPAVKIEKTYVTVKNEVLLAKKAKSIKNKIKNENEKFSDEEKNELLDIVVSKITEEKAFESTWFGNAISEWMTSESLSNKERKNLIGNDYFDILKTLLK